MAFVTGFTLETCYELSSDQGSHSLKLTVGYELDSEDLDLAAAIASKAGEHHTTSALLHRLLSESQSGRSVSDISPRQIGTSDRSLTEGLSSLPAAVDSNSFVDADENNKAEMAAGEINPDVDERSPESSRSKNPIGRVDAMSALEAAGTLAAPEQVLQIREILFRDNVADEDFGRDLKSRFGKYYPEELTRLQASTVLFEMRNRERFRARALEVCPKNGA